MSPNEIQCQRELLAFAEKLALAELEVAKAVERVKELAYQKQRYALDFFIQSQKQANAEPI